MRNPKHDGLRTFVVTFVYSYEERELVNALTPERAVMHTEKNPNKKVIKIEEVVPVEDPSNRE